MSELDRCGELLAVLQYADFALCNVDMVRICWLRRPNFN